MSPSCDLKEPTAQNSNAPLLLKEPAAATHSETSKALAFNVVEPSGQLTHAAFAEVALYVPFTHSTHVSKALPSVAYPFTHRQLAEEIVAARDSLKSLHARHASASLPLVSLNVPAPHAEHAFATTGSA
jgi:hypothetical protein